MTAPQRPQKLPTQAPLSNAAGQPVPQQSAQYTNAGAISVNEALNGDPSKYAHLGPAIQSITDRIQRDLVENSLAEALTAARTGSADDRAALVREIDRRALTYSIPIREIRGENQQYVIASVINEIIGLGPIEPLWQDPKITEVMVNGPNQVFVERDGKLLPAHGTRFRDESHLLDICQKIVAPLNRKLDVKDSLTDGRLPDGSRVNAVHMATAPHGPLLTIRRFPEMNRSIADLVDLDMMSKDMAINIAWLVKARVTILVSGGTGSGKTTLLNALSSAIPHNERVVTIEDSLELRLDARAHVAALEARPGDAKGENEITIRSLVKNSLRMRPDRVVVGEVRDESALEMLQACNTGHEGSMSTVHANGPNETLSRLTVMVAQGGDIPADKVDWLVGSALDLIIMIKRYQDGVRRVSGIYEVPESLDTERLATIPLWEWRRTGATPDGIFIGDYEHVNDISEKVREKLGLDWEPKPSWEEVRALAGGMDSNLFGSHQDVLIADNTSSKNTVPNPEA